jgi:hypothetical protein
VGVLETTPLVAAVTIKVPRMYCRHAARGHILGAITAHSSSQRELAASRRAASSCKSCHGAHEEGGGKGYGRPLSSENHNTCGKKVIKTCLAQLREKGEKRYCLLGGTGEPTRGWAMLKRPQTRCDKFNLATSGIVTNTCKYS